MSDRWGRRPEPQTIQDNWKRIIQKVTQISIIVKKLSYRSVIEFFEVIPVSIFSLFNLNLIHYHDIIPIINDTEMNRKISHLQSHQ
jgi:hypothetical protein